MLVSSLSRKMFWPILRFVRAMQLPSFVVAPGFLHADYPVERRTSVARTEQQCFWGKRDGCYICFYVDFPVKTFHGKETFLFFITLARLYSSLPAFTK